MSTKDKLVSIAKQMCGLPFADRIMVFGSMAKGSGSPGDIDVFVDLRGQSFTDSNQCNEFDALIRLSINNYGLVDPFLRFDNKLIVRNDAATAWTTAKNSRAICKNMDVQAKPISKVIHDYEIRLARDSDGPSMN